MKKLFFILLVLTTTVTSACTICFATRQYKSFPVGISEDKIISIDFLVRRSHSVKDNKKQDEIRLPETMWILESYISHYDLKMNLISKKTFEDEVINNEKYISLLKSMYTKGLNLIKKNEKDKIDYFKPEYISFCNYQKKCKKLAVKHDTINKKDYFVYKKKEYQVSLKNYPGFNESALYTDNLSSYYISSIRIFKTKKIELVVAHLETGHEISMGYITNDPKDKNSKEPGVYYVEEETPKFNFKHLKNAVYEEPLLHHAFGYDLMVIHK